MLIPVKESCQLFERYFQAVADENFELAYCLINSIDIHLSDINSIKNFVIAQKQILSRHINQLDKESVSEMKVNRKELFEQRYETLLKSKLNPNKGISKIRQGEHLNWYFNHNLANQLKNMWGGECNILNHNIKKILVIGNDMEQKTGVLRSISAYLNLLYHYGGYEIQLIEFEPKAEQQAINLLFNSFDLVIINGIPQLFLVEGLINVIERVGKQKSIYWYIHATKWSFERFNSEQISILRKAVLSCNLMLVSEAQKEDISQYIQKPNSYCIVRELPLIHNSDSISKNTQQVYRLPNTVLNIGTICERKGTSFFSECADFCSKENGKHSFYWIGSKHSQDEYLSPKVEFMGFKLSHEITNILRSIEIFFLSSFDDPFPHAVFEAYLNGCKLLIPSSSGVVEILEGMSGVIIYDTHDESNICDYLNILSKMDFPSRQDICSVEKQLSIKAFNEKITSFINTTFIQKDAGISELYSSNPIKKKILVVIHLYYLDLSYEFARYLNSLQSQSVDLYITIPLGSNEGDIRDVFLGLCDNLYIFEIDNKGLDLGGFFYVMDIVRKNKTNYDYCLKLHSKKSFTSGSGTGEQWRELVWDILNTSN